MKIRKLPGFIIIINILFFPYICTAVYLNKEIDRPVLANIINRTDLTTLTYINRPILGVKDDPDNPNLKTDPYWYDDPLIEKYEPDLGEDFYFRNDFHIPRAKNYISTNALSVLYFMQITDAHITDEESPARDVLKDSKLLDGFFRPQEQYSTQVFDTMIRTANQISHETNKNFDMLLLTGDLVENSLKIELDWFYDIINGKYIDPDSGLDENPYISMCEDIPFFPDDANDPFLAEGLRSEIPWYVAMGNHDGFLYGNLSQDTIKEEVIINFPHDPLASISKAPVFPAEDYLSLNEIKDLVNKKRETERKKKVSFDISSDPERRLFSEKEFYEKLISHGFDYLEGYYTITFDSHIPIKMIVLNTWPKCSAVHAMLYEKQIEDFLIPELEKSKGKELVIIASHHGKNIIKKNNILPFATARKCIKKQGKQYSGKDLEKILSSYEEVIMHIAGHSHKHEVHARDNYWEVVTSSLIDFPMQSRLFDIIIDQQIGYIYSVVVDAADKLFSNPGLITRAREIALMDMQTGNVRGSDYWGTYKERNVILPFRLPSWLKRKL
ncbi:MAG: metallophosphoesterase [Pseudomonadota bacterium]